MHRFIQIGICVVLTIAVSPLAGKVSGLREVKDEKYNPGQVWSYKSRAGEQASTLTILRVEEYAEKKRIVHIRVEHIRLKNCTGGPEPDLLQHMPFSREALDESVVDLLRSGAVPDFHEGYSEWRAAWDAHKAGFYTITVAKALDVTQATFDHGLGCPK